ncbi:MAG: hypothetical protein V1779_03895 [bacterium]
MKLKLYILLFLLSLNLCKSSNIEILWQYQIHGSMINKLLFNNSEEMIISCSSDKTIKMTNSQTGEIINDFTFENNIYDLALIPDENLLLVSQKHRTNSKVCIFNMETKSEQISFDLRLLLDSNVSVQNQEFIEVHALPISKTMILTGIGIYSYSNANHYYKGRLDLWDINTGAWVKEVFSGGMVNNLVISPDGKSIAFSTIQRTSEYIANWVYKEIEETKLFTTDTSFSEFSLLREDYDENMEYADTEVINEIAYSKDSKFIALATDDHHLFVFSIDNKILQDSIFSCSCYADQSIGFVFNGEYILSGTNNGKINFWNLEFKIGIDSHTYPENPMITSIATSNTKNLYAIADVKGNISMITWWYINDVPRQIIVNKPEYNISYTNDKLELELLNDYFQVDTRIYDILGKPINNINTVNTGNRIIFTTEQLATGIYFLTTTIDGITVIEKFQKFD